MDPLEFFRSAVDDLEQIQSAMSGIAASPDANWKRQIIESRRKLQAQISVVSEAIRQCESGMPSPELTVRLLVALSKMRSTLAIHQAKWPAVAIDVSSADYAESLASVRQANRTFISLAREALASRPALIPRSN